MAINSILQSVILLMLLKHLRLLLLELLHIILLHFHGLLLDILDVFVMTGLNIDDLPFQSAYLNDATGIYLDNLAILPLNYTKIDGHLIILLKKFFIFLSKADLLLALQISISVYSMDLFFILLYLSREGVFLVLMIQLDLFFITDHLQHLAFHSLYLLRVTLPVFFINL